MPLATNYPTANGATNNWSLAGGPTKWQAVGDDDTVNYVWSATNAAQQFFVDAGGPVNALDPYNAVTQYFKAARLVGTARNMNIWDGNAFQAQALTASWTLYSRAWYSLVVANLGTAQEVSVGVPTGTDEVDVTLMYRVIDYNLSAVTFMSLLYGLGPFIGAGLLLSEMPRLSRFMFGRLDPVRRVRTRLRPDEYGQAWQDWRAYRWPRHFELSTAT